MISLPTPLCFQEIHNYLNSQFIEPAGKDQCLRKYHILNRSDQTYQKRLQATFRGGYQILNRDEFLQTGSWFAEIYYFDPQYSQTFSFIQEQFFTKTIANVMYSKEKQSIGLYIGLASKLIQRQQIQSLLNEIQILSSDLSTNSQEILKRLAVIEGSLRWENYWKGIFLKTKSSQFSQIIHQIFKNFQENSTFNNEKVIMGKIKLINASLDYYLNAVSPNSNKSSLGDESLLLKSVIIEEVWKCEAAIPLFEENQQEVLELILKSMKLYGVYDEEKISQLLSKNEHKIHNLTFLEIFKLFLEKTNKINTKTSEILNLLLTKALDSIFCSQRSTFEQTFKVIKEISDIIIMSFSFCTFNFTKEITHRLKILKEDYHRKFLTTLLLIYNSKLEKDIMNAIIPDLQKVFYHNQCFHPYENMIKSFGSLDLNIIDYAQDPEKKDEALLWELLTLRNAIKVDYKSLSQNNYVYGIYRNLLKFILCNIFYGQCTQIVSQICNFKQQNSQNNLGDLNFYQLVQEIMTIQIPCVSSLSCFSQILLTHKQNFLSGSFSCLSLFMGICELLRMVFDKNGGRSQLRKVSVHLLRVSLPETFEMLSDEMLYEAHQSLIRLMLTDANKEFFHVYLDFMYLSIHHRNMQLKLVKDSRIVQYISNNTEIQSYSLDKFEILDYMINHNRFQLHIADKIWQNIKFAIHSQEKDIFLYFIQIFHYFNSMLQANAQADQHQSSLFFMFLNDQTLKTISIIDQIYAKIDESFLVQNLSNLMQMLQAFQVSLYKNLLQIQKHEQIGLTNSFYDLPKETSNWFKKLEKYQQFECFQTQKTVRSLWNCCYLSLMLITCLSYRMCHKSFDCFSFSYQAMRQKLNHCKSVVGVCQKNQSEEVLQFDKMLTQECRFVVLDSRFTLK